MLDVRGMSSSEKQANKLCWGNLSALQRQHDTLL